MGRRQEETGKERQRKGEKMARERRARKMRRARGEI